MQHCRVKSRFFTGISVFIQCCICWLYIACTSLAQADEQFLPQDQAFAFEVKSINQAQAQLQWLIAPEYYLYKHQIAVKVEQTPVQFSLPPAQPKYDEYFGDTEVYYQQLSFTVRTQANQTYLVTYQGCAEKGLCYPLQRTKFSTDANGLVILEPQLRQNSASNMFAQAASQSDLAISESTKNLSQVEDSAQIAQDQKWSDRLHQQSFIVSLIIFLGLGCLLAFTPCSLPMLPILSSLLIRKHAGVKAIFISLTFVLAMASVYALLGIVAASAGSNFQRWLQQPIVLVTFSLIFIIFALNLFGLFELKLPQAWANRLDRLQAKQQGGTLVGAGVMGMLSALLVGPCMTAPLAGTLLYISQTQNIVIGAVLLFCLGLGMGIPLLILTLLGQKALPKPGVWMNYVRHIFAFLMLGLSLYFIRPLLSEQMLNMGFLLIIVGLACYLLWIIKREQKVPRYLAALAFVILLIGTTWQSVSYWHYQQSASTQVWQVVTNKAEFEQALLQAQRDKKAIVIDLYADWCIACQPLEREVWAHPQVQIALDDVIKIKMDLSDYHPDQQKILNEWQLLGPPTALFLDVNGQEQRALRLTGSFKRDDLIERLKILTR